jgi:hypothetical protein
VRTFNSGIALSDLPPGHIARAYTAIWPVVSPLDGEPDTLLVVNRARLIVPEGVVARNNVLRIIHIPHTLQVKNKKTATRLY